MPSPARSAVVVPTLAALILGLSAGLVPAVADPEGSLPSPGAAAALSESLLSLDQDVASYMAHVVTLSDPFMEGRVPGSRGNELAQEYLEFYFRRAGLEPLFAESTTAHDGTEVLTPGASHRQVFNVLGDVEVTAAEASWKAGPRGSTLDHGEEFSVLGVSGTRRVEGPVVFVGYGIDNGPDGYTSFGPHDDLSGKIALLYRFEPMTEAGTSRWQEFSGWSHHAGLTQKIRAAVDRGAAGVILVNPPDAADDRAEKLLSTQGSRFGRAFDVPVVMLAPDAARLLVAAADPQDRSLMDLRRHADEKDSAAAVIDLPDAVVSLNAGVRTLEIPTANVAGLLRGKGDLADQHVVIGAHYDHLGYGHFGSRDKDPDGRLHPGADDNASGTAGLIMLANWLSAEYAALPDDVDLRSIIFVGFSAEESGLNGSRYFVEHPPVATSAITAMLNMDMIGRLRENIEVGGVRTAEGFEDWLAPIFGAADITVKTSGGGQGPSDHASFYAADIPVLFFFTGLHEEYHTSRDVSTTLNYPGAVRVLRLVESVAKAIAARSEPFSFTSTGTVARVGSMRGVSVRLGIAPGNYADDQPGVAIGEVYENTSAANAGMMKGDRIVRWGGEELADVGTMMERLAAHKPGDVVEIIVVRDGAEVPLQVKLLPRQQRDR